MHWSLTSLLLILLLLLPTIVVAQFSGEAGEPFTVVVSAEVPRSRSQVTVTPVSGEVDIANATMSVKVNGAQTYSGSAEPVPVTVGEAGKVTTIMITMKIGAKSYVETISITPQDIALVVEPLSSAHPLYPGKTLVPLEGNVRVIALADMRAANGAVLDPTTLGYAWSVDDVRVLSGSGLGKRIIIIDSPLQYRTRTISVTVTSPDGRERGTASVVLEASEPTVRLYEHDPLAGIRFDRALSSAFAIEDGEATLNAVPFSFPTALRAPAIEWYVGNMLSETGNLITLRPAGRGVGSAKLTARSTGNAGLSASKSITITYGATPSSGFFGL
jgi:hypothetical protein